MKKIMWVVALLATAAGTSALAGHDGDSTLWVTNVENEIDSGWVPHFPSGSSDFFNVAHEVVPGIGDTKDVANGLPVTGLAVSVCDFGSGRTFEVVGIYEANLGLDSSGKTPDLASPLARQFHPPLVPPPLFEYVVFDLPAANIPGGTTFVHTVVQFPIGDSGLLGIGADSGGSGTATSGFSTDGYATPAILASFLDFGLNPGQDNSTTTSCKPADRKPHGRLRVSSPKLNVGAGDRFTLKVKAGDAIDLAFFGPRSGDALRLYYSAAPCTPLVAVGPALTTLADGDGTGSYLRMNATWPAGYGGQTFQFAAAWGNFACPQPGAGFTNCVTVITPPDPTYGVCDDGTCETGWVVQIPSGSSDYFNNSFGSGVGKNGIVALTLSVLDFGTMAAGYPTSGVSNANLGVDPSGHTPDIASPLATVSPFTFPPLSFETTSGLYTSHAVSIPGGSLSSNVHGWVQFPPGDPGLLAVGGDTTQNNGCSFFSLDGYASPAVSFFVNWGIRIKTN